MVNDKQREIDKNIHISNSVLSNHLKKRVTNVKMSHLFHSNHLNGWMVFISIVHWIIISPIAYCIFLTVHIAPNLVPFVLVSLSIYVVLLGILLCIMREKDSSCTRNENNCTLCPKKYFEFPWKRFRNESTSEMDNEDVTQQSGDRENFSNVSSQKECTPEICYIIVDSTPEVFNDQPINNWRLIWSGWRLGKCQHEKIRLWCCKTVCNVIEIELAIKLYLLLIFVIICEPNICGKIQ